MLLNICDNSLFVDYFKFLFMQIVTNRGVLFDFLLGSRTLFF